MLSLLGACKTPLHLAQIQALALKSRQEADPFFASKLFLTAAVTLQDSLPQALRLFCFLPPPLKSDPFFHNSIIRGFEQIHQPSSSLQAYIFMRRSAVPPDSFTFVFSLKAAAAADTASLAGPQLHAQSFLHGLSTHLFVSTTLISMYAEHIDLVSALKLFDEMPVRNLVSWNAAITACTRFGDMDRAESLFASMPARNSTSWNLLLAGYIRWDKIALARIIFLRMPEKEKDPVTFSTMISGYVNNWDFEEAFVFFKESLGRGLPPNEVMLTSSISACANGGFLVLASSIHAFVNKSGCGHLVAVCNSLVDTYAKCGDLAMAKRIFYVWLEKTKNLISWTAMISGLAMNGCGEEAVELFLQMELCGVYPDVTAFVSLLYACSHGGLVEEGRQFFTMMKEKYGLQHSIEHYGCMVDIYARAGMLDEAYELATLAPEKDSAVVWRTVLGACRVHGNAAMAKQVRIRLGEVDPDEVGDCVILCNTLAAEGRWGEVEDIRGAMKQKKKQKPLGWSAIEVELVKERN